MQLSEQHEVLLYLKDVPRERRSRFRGKLGGRESGIRRLGAGGMKSSKTSWTKGVKRKKSQWRLEVEETGGSLEKTDGRRDRHAPQQDNEGHSAAEDELTQQKDSSGEEVGWLGR